MVKENNTNKRETLENLTTKFVDYLFKNNLTSNISDVLNLKILSKKLNIKKRRLYDLTNVLEGIGYLKKYKRNSMKLSKDFIIQILNLKIEEVDKKIELIKGKKITEEINEQKNITKKNITKRKIYFIVKKNINNNFQNKNSEKKNEESSRNLLHKNKNEEGTNENSYKKSLNIEENNENQSMKIKAKKLTRTQTIKLAENHENSEYYSENKEVDEKSCFKIMNLGENNENLEQENNSREENESSFILAFKNIFN